MSYYSNFDNFDPVKEDIPAYAIESLGSIANRARFLLSSRTSEQIKFAASSADFVVEEFFIEAIGKYTEQLISSSDHEILRDMESLGYKNPNSDQIANYMHALPNEHHDVPEDLQHPENTSSLYALKKSVERYHYDSPEFPNGKPSEIFAAVALSLFFKSYRDLHYNEDYPIFPSKNDGTDINPVTLWLEPGEKIPKASEIKLRLEAVSHHRKVMSHYSVGAINALSEATDAICYAECLLELTARESMIFDLSDRINDEEATVENLVGQKFREKVSFVAKKAASVRHEENRALKQDVFDWCHKHLASYRTLDEAAEAAKPLVPATVGTVRKWITAFLKEYPSARKR